MTPDRWITLLIPRASLSGNTAKLPTKPPTLIIDTTSEASSNDNGPVGNVVLSLWRSLKLIVAHAVAEPNENVNKLPVLSESL